MMHLPYSASALSEQAGKRSHVSLAQARELCVDRKANLGEGSERIDMGSSSHV